MNIMAGFSYGDPLGESALAGAKVCITCGKTMERPRGAKRVSDRRWHAKLFCSRACIRPYDRDPDAEPEVPPAVSARIASRKLLKALVRYGLRHDGLPGLPAVRLMTLAKELGVSA